MHRFFNGLIALVLLITLFTCTPSGTYSEKEFALIPQVRSSMFGQYTFTIRPGTSLVVENVDQYEIARYFGRIFEQASGHKLKILIGGDEGSNQIYFKTETMMDPEAYTFEIQKNRIEVKASKLAGFFYAVESLRQLLPPEIECSSPQSNVEWEIPAVRISDNPAHKIRSCDIGLVQPKYSSEDFFHLIDLLAFHKINTLQIRLIDKKGWGLKIDKYPRIAGRVRQITPETNTQDSAQNADCMVCYTSEELKEIIAYARMNFITVVPEIDITDFVATVFSASPDQETSESAAMPSKSIISEMDRPVIPRDSTLLFLEDVLAEVIALFPSKYVCLPVDKDSLADWVKWPQYKAIKKASGFKNERQLQAYIIARLQKFILAKGKELVVHTPEIQAENTESVEDVTWPAYNGMVMSFWRIADQAENGWCTEKTIRASDFSHRFLLMNDRYRLLKIKYSAREQAPLFRQSVNYNRFN